MNGQSASTPPGPQVTLGTAFDIIVVVFNDGNVPLTNLTGSSDLDDVSCQDTYLPVGEPTYCGLTAQAGPGAQQIVMTFQAQGPGGNIVQAQSVTYYRGVSPPITP